MLYLHQLFPNAKFIFMVRDGRAVAASLIKHYKEPNYFATFTFYVKLWNEYNQQVYELCQNLTERSCLIVKYEQLTKLPEVTLKRVTQFLNVKYSSDMLEHEKFISTRIKLNPLEWSSHQVKNPIFSSSIDEWKRNLPEGFNSQQFEFAKQTFLKLNYSFSSIS